MQATVHTEENETWGQKAAVFKDGFYEINGKPELPKYLYPAIVQGAHGKAHPVEEPD